MFIVILHIGISKMQNSTKSRSTIRTLLIYLPVYPKKHMPLPWSEAMVFDRQHINRYLI